jgi:hypothetical protein
MLLQAIAGREGQLYQIHDDAGMFIRYADMDGNTIPLGEEFSATLVEADVAAPVWHVDPGPAPEPEPTPGSVPESITKLQFLTQLLRSGFVTAEEVPTLAVTPPAFLAPVFAAMPVEAALEAELAWSAMTQVERNSPTTLAALATGLVTEAQLDDFFRAASVI